MTARDSEPRPKLSPLAATIVVVVLLVLAASGYLRGPQEARPPDRPPSTASRELAPESDSQSGDTQPDEPARRTPKSAAPSIEDSPEAAASGTSKPAAPEASPGKTSAPKTSPPKSSSPKKADDSKGGERSDSAGDEKLRIENVVIRDQSGRVSWRGEIDLKPTLDRIEAGERNTHRNDGAVFQNREGRLPRKGSGYYHEYVHPTPGISGPGPQRVILGREGEVYYTFDHYETFRRIR